MAAAALRTTTTKMIWMRGAWIWKVLEREEKKNRKRQSFFFIYYF
jgi:hypothetical protein